MKGYEAGLTVFGLGLRQVVCSAWSDGVAHLASPTLGSVQFKSFAPLQVFQTKQTEIKTLPSELGLLHFAVRSVTAKLLIMVFSLTS